MKKILLLLALFGCQSAGDRLREALEREYGAGVAVVSYRLVGDGFLDTVRLRMLQSEWDYFETMSRLKAGEAKRSARVGGISAAVMPSMKGFFKDDMEENLREMKLYIDSLEMVIRTDSVLKERIKRRQNDAPKYFHVKGVTMAGDTVWGIYDKDFRVVKVDLQWVGR